MFTKKDIPVFMFICAVFILQSFLLGVPVTVLTLLILALVITLWEIKDRKRIKKLATDIESLGVRIKESAAKLEQIKNDINNNS